MRLLYKSVLLLLLIISPNVEATNKEDTIIELSVVNNKMQNNIVDVSANLFNADGRPVDNQILVFYINDRIFTNKITDNKGYSNIQFQALEEVYKVQVKFDGSQTYRETESEIIIVQKTEENNNIGQKIPNELLIVISVLTLGIAGTGILYYLNKNSKREL